MASGTATLMDWTPLCQQFGSLMGRVFGCTMDTIPGNISVGLYTHPTQDTKQQLSVMKLLNINEHKPSESTTSKKTLRQLP